MKSLFGLGASLLVGLAATQGCSSDEKSGTGGPLPEAGSSGGGGGASSSGGVSGATTGGRGGASGASTGGSGGSRSPDQTGSSCKTANDCFPNVADAAALSGAVECIAKVQDGYCTHRCDTDADCCAVPGECRTTLKQVCSPFENQGYKVCFLSCEGADLRGSGDAGTTLPDGGAIDPNEYCQREANVDFTCRSTGGGSANRKVCVPGGAPGDGGRPVPDGGGPSDAAADTGPG